MHVSMSYHYCGNGPFGRPIECMYVC